MTNIEPKPLSFHIQDIKKHLEAIGKIARAFLKKHGGMMESNGYDTYIYGIVSSNGSGRLRSNTPEYIDLTGAEIRDLNTELGVEILHYMDQRGIKSVEFHSTENSACYRIFVKYTVTQEI